MPALVTNAWAAWLPDPLTRRHFSRLIVEGYGDLTGYLRSVSPVRVAFIAPGAELNMPPAVLPVYDGIVEEVAIREEPAGVTAEARLAEPAGARLTLMKGTPARAVVDFSAAPLVALLRRRVVVLDAGHGSPDPGGLGPIDLLEKNVVLDMVLRLEKLVEQAGGIPLLTRRGDAGPAADARAEVVREARPVAVISLHTHWSPDPRVKGFAVYYHRESARPLAEAIRTNLSRKLALSDRGLYPAAGPPFSPSAHQPGHSLHQTDNGLGAPTVTVETVTISNPVEEGWLRSCVFRQRVAQAVFNGLASHLRVTNPGPRA
ncbi:MAG: N-acetylmuramoyl-L-alanine amidase [Bacillota bacterium]|nr:N-acetylmuramoyl-L-alanine amidase [Bacillota bacterium]